MRYFVILSLGIIFMILFAGCVSSPVANTQKLVNGNNIVVPTTVEPPSEYGKSALTANPMAAALNKNKNEELKVTPHQTLAYGEFSSSENSVIFNTSTPNATPTIIIIPTLPPDPNTTIEPTPVPTITKVPITVVPTPIPTITVVPTLTPSPTKSPTPVPTVVPTSVPSGSVKLIFIHHSSGSNWLSDNNGGLGAALKNNKYYVSDTNYGWGSIGDYTDLGNWYDWFRGPDSASIMGDVYSESSQHSTYSRMSTNPGGENTIIMFKSCYPNSELYGSVNDPIPTIANNPMKSQSSGSESYTISNAKGIYIDLLEYFKQHQDKLFIVVTAPPLSSSTYASNARAFNQWLVNDWLDNYPYKNVAVYDFYNVLTTNGGSASTNDIGSSSGNHHRMLNGVVQHQYDGTHNTLAYYSGDDHPSAAGNKKATSEFLPYLNYVYNRWKGVTTPVVTPTQSPIVTPVVTPQSGDYGYGSNPTGNPIGGGVGYTRIISQSSAKYIVSTKSEFLLAISSSTSGNIIFVKSDAVIDMTGTSSVTIPGGVTIASDRGLSGSLGGLFKRTKNLNGGWEEPMFIAGGDNVRITGLRLEGEMYPQDYGNGEVYPGSIYEQYYLVGISAQNKKGLEIDNCELRGWSWAAISLRGNVNSPIPYIHHNYIHHNQARGEGYGVCLYGGNALIEANTFDYNRHDVTGAGMSGEQYEVRYNHVIGNGNAIGASHFDVHADEESGTSYAGYKFLIHHNTVDKGTVATVHIRAKPQVGCYVNNNIINAKATDTGVPGGLPIFETGSSSNMFVTNNYWMGTLYSGGNGIVWYQ